MWGTKKYHVEIAVFGYELLFSCTCPYSGNGYFCKHMVAGGLFTRDLITKRGVRDWKGSLSEVMKALDKPGIQKRPRPYLLVFSLQQDYYSNWFIQPYTMPYNSLAEELSSEIESENGIVLAEFIERNPWIMNSSKVPRNTLDSDQCVNCPPEIVSVANILIHDLFHIPTHYAYFNTRRPIVEYLDLIKTLNIPLFLGDTNVPCRQQIHVIPENGEIQLELARGDDGLRISTTINWGETRLSQWENSPHIISLNPPWLLIMPYLLRLSNDQPSDVLELFVQKQEIHVPVEGETEFLEQFLLPLANKE